MREEEGSADEDDLENAIELKNKNKSALEKLRLIENNVCLIMNDLKEQIRFRDHFVTYHDFDCDRDLM